MNWLFYCYRLRIPLKSAKAITVGFLTINVWNLEAEDKGNSTESTPSRNVLTTNNQVNKLNIPR